MRSNRRNQKTIKNNELIMGDVEQELYIEEECINEELMDQPLKFRKWSKMEVRCERKVKTLRLALENAEAKAYHEARKSQKKHTIKDLENAVKMDERVQELKEELIEAEGELSDIKMIVKSFYQRHEVLKDIAANLRKELLD